MKWRYVLGKYKRDVFCDNKERVRVNLWRDFEIKKRLLRELLLPDINSFTYTDGESSMGGNGSKWCLCSKGVKIWCKLHGAAIQSS